MSIGKPYENFKSWGMTREAQPQLRRESGVP